MSIANLNLAPVEVLSDEQYEPPSNFELPNDGEYTFQLPTTFPDDSFGEDKRRTETQGHLQVLIDPTIIADGDGESTRARNYTLRYQRASVRINSFRKSSQIADLLMGLGESPSEMPTDPREAVEWLRETLAGQTFRGYARAECSVKLRNGDYLNLRGRKDFDAAALRAQGIAVADEATGFQANFPSPWETDPKTGDAKVLYANLRIARVIVPESD